MKSEYPKSIRGYNEIAGLINRKFGTELGMLCDKVTITRWRHSVHLPEGVGPFPAPNPDNNFFQVAECFEWVAGYIAAKKLKPTKTITEIEAKAEAARRREIAKANREERLDRKEAGEVIDRAVAENDAIGIVQRLHNACTYHDENEIPNFCAETLKNLGASVELITTFSAKLTEKMQGITLRRVEMFKASASEFLKNA